jgi:hypothetical protein
MKGYVTMKHFGATATVHDVTFSPLKRGAKPERSSLLFQTLVPGSFYRPCETLVQQDCVPDLSGRWTFVGSTLQRICSGNRVAERRRVADDKSRRDFLGN